MEATGPVLLESVLTLKGPGLNSLTDCVALPHLRMPPIDWMPNSFINALAVECAAARVLKQLLESMAASVPKFQRVMRVTRDGTD